MLCVPDRAHSLRVYFVGVDQIQVEEELQSGNIALVLGGAAERGGLVSGRSSTVVDILHYHSIANWSLIFLS